MSILKNQSRVTAKPITSLQGGAVSLSSGILSHFLNRVGSDGLPVDGWIQLTPIGTFLHRPSGLEQVIDDASIKSMINRFEEDAKQENFPGLLLDFDHFSNDTQQSSAAAGWIVALQQRDDGLWGKVDWSGSGAQAVQNKEYKGVSPVWNAPDCQKVDQNTIRPLRLDRAAITNDPNLKGMAPLTNREEILNYGTSAGAKKGWETRKGGASAASKPKPEKKAPKGKAATTRKTSDQHQAASGKSISVPKPEETKKATPPPLPPQKKTPPPLPAPEKKGPPPLPQKKTPPPLPVSTSSGAGNHVHVHVHTPDSALHAGLHDPAFYQQRRAAQKRRR